MLGSQGMEVFHVRCEIRYIESSFFRAIEKLVYVFRYIYQCKQYWDERRWRSKTRSIRHSIQRKFDIIISIYRKFDILISIDRKFDILLSIDRKFDISKVRYLNFDIWKYQRKRVHTGTIGDRWEERLIRHIEGLIL